MIDHDKYIKEIDNAFKFFETGNSLYKIDQGFIELNSNVYYENKGSYFEVTYDIYDNDDGEKLLYCYNYKLKKPTLLHQLIHHIVTAWKKMF